MSAIGKGDWVECLKSEEYEGDAVVAGRAYYCEGLLQWLDWLCEDCGREGHMALVLTGVTTPDHYWCPCTFKPLGGNSKTAPPQAVITEWERALQDA